MKTFLVNGVGCGGRPTSHCSRRGAPSRPGSLAAYDSATQCVALLPREHPAQLSDMGLDGSRKRQSARGRVLG
jgi:hypothetical protein